MPEIRLIDANALKDRLPTFAGVIDEQPTIEPEVRHGRWRFEKGDNKTTCDGWICTECNYGFHTKVPYFDAFNFCPMCGAKMDGGADNG